MFMGARGGRRGTGGSALALVASGVLGLTACAESGSSTRSGEDTPQIGLQRGSRWSVLTLKPPHLTGPQFNLVLKDGVLSGSISGGTAPGGNVHVSIAEDGAE